MLIEIKKLLEEREQMSLMDLARHFYVSENIMQSMLAQWVKKGRVEIREQGGLCGSTCGSCDESGQVKILYRWKKIAQKPIYTMLQS